MASSRFLWFHHTVVLESLFLRYMRLNPGKTAEDFAEIVSVPLAELAACLRRQRPLSQASLNQISKCCFFEDSKEAHLFKLLSTYWENPLIMEQEKARKELNERFGDQYEILLQRYLHDRTVILQTWHVPFFDMIVSKRCD